jgi:hypothetical protein
MGQLDFDASRELTTDCIERPEDWSFFRRRLRTYLQTSDAWFQYLKNGVFERAQPVFG